MVRPRSCGFALIELVVLFAVILLSVSLLFPVLSHVRCDTQRVRGLAQQRAIGAAVTVYVIYHANELPSAYTVWFFGASGFGVTKAGHDRDLSWHLQGSEISPRSPRELEMPGHPEVKICRASEIHSPRVMIFMLDGMGG